MEEDEQSKRLILSGHILIPATAAGIERGIAKVDLEEITGEDAPALVIAEVEVQDIKHVAGGSDTLIPFTVSLSSKFVVDSRRDYALRVWIDHDGDGQQSAGDLYSTERQRVFAGDKKKPIVIRVTR